MTKRDKGANETYFVHLDIGAGVKYAGITFKQGVPHAVPELYKEDFEKSPVFAKVADGTKIIPPAECAKLLKGEMKAATGRRDEWRKNRAAGNKEAPANAPPEPEPEPPATPEAPSKEAYK